MLVSKANMVKSGLPWYSKKSMKLLKLIPASASIAARRGVRNICNVPQKTSVRATTPAKMLQLPENSGFSACKTSTPIGSSPSRIPCINKWCDCIFKRWLFMFLYLFAS